jgi:5-methylcytosine-specific restriction enzyme A
MNPSRESIVLAMGRFDSEFREAKHWQQWEQNKAHKYAVSYNGKLYPVKQIVSLAIGVPVSDFSGGDGSGQANGAVKKAGFEVNSLHSSNPNWTKDEHILALDLYLRTRPKTPDKESKEIKELSQALNRLGEKLFSRQDRSDIFRNPAGVYMKLMNFRRLDPQYTESGRVGLTRGAGGEEEVWATFSNDPARCASVAFAILRILDSEEFDQAFVDPDENDGMSEAAEGRMFTRLHVIRERNRALVASKRKSVLKANGKLFCEICDFDFEAKYGIRGRDFIECHHTRPIAALAVGGKTHINDLALVCSNCHRMIHRRQPWLSLDELRNMIARTR